MRGLKNRRGVCVLSLVALRTSTQMASFRRPGPTGARRRRSAETVSQSLERPCEGARGHDEAFAREGRRP